LLTESTSAARTVSRANNSRAKVVLYNPDAVFYTMPLALVAVGSHLDPEQYEVVIIDGRITDDPVEAINAQLDDAVCLGVTVLTGAPIQDALRISRAVKACHSDLPVVWGGWHPSMFGRECLEESSVDVTIQGQGEVTFAEIVARLVNGRSLDGCAGCTYRDDVGAVHVNGPRSLADVNGLRRHDYSAIDVTRYYELKGKRQLDYVSSQGCRFRCAFCADPFVYERLWSGIAPERIGEEVEDLWHRYRFDDLSFQDETYFTYAPRVEAMAEEFLRRNLPITWAATMRADQCYRLPERVFALCKESGFRRALIGVESGSQEMMDRIKKDIKIEQVFFAAERCRKYGVAAIFPFIVGFPDEEEHHIQATMDVAKRLRAMHPNFETPIFYFKPYPGSIITQGAVANGFELPSSLDEWSRFDFIGSAGPWVSPETRRRIERFKFYQQLAWNQPSLWSRPFRRLALWRCSRDRYAWPVEMVIGNWLNPREPLS
jgi:radical SAM superfamily enzyme YgiQ (UPF0313 family)